MAVTVHDVARKANVSVGTVSRFLNGYHLREHNRLRVEEAIKELGFTGNIMARGLKQRKSMTIALVTPDFDIFTTSITTIIEQMLEKEKYSLIICDYQRDREKLKRKLLFLKDRLIDGVILFPSNLASASMEVLQKYISRKVPVVLVDHLVPGLETDAVVVDNINASFRAVEELIRHNHQKIAIVNGRKDSVVSQERLQGFYNAMQTYDLPLWDEWIAWGEFSQMGGYKAIKQMFSLPEAPTAVYTTDYSMTIGAVLALHERRLRIPDDVSVVGFDHFESIDLIEPPLTMVEQPIKLIAQNVVQLMMKRIHQEYSDFASTIKLNTKMVIGESVKMM